MLSWLLGRRRGLLGAHRDINNNGLPMAYKILSNSEDMMLYAQESLWLMRSLAREVVHRCHLRNL
jgi:hypothetical protein